MYNGHYTQYRVLSGDWFIPFAFQSLILAMYRGDDRSRKTAFRGTYYIIVRVRVFGCPFKWLRPAHKWTGLRHRLGL